VLDLIRPLGDADSRDRIAAERALNTRLAGGCQVPIGGHATLHGDELLLRGLVGRPDGTVMVRGEVRGARGDGLRLGTELGDELLANGAREILAALYESEGHGD